jgi:very-short-patch-repair endonuclease
MCSPRQNNLCRDKECETCNPRRPDSIMIRQCWILSKNPGIRPLTIPKSSNKSFWFRCKNCGHHTFSRMGVFAGSKGCIYCIGNHSLCTEGDCPICNDRRDPVMLKYWDYGKNVNIDPLTIARCSHKQYWFRCKKCSHPTYAVTENFNMQNDGCTYCEGNQILCTDHDCLVCNRRRDPIMIENWIPGMNNGIDVWTVPKKYHFECRLCSHVVECTASAYTGDNDGCKFCKGRYLCNDYDCTICISNRFSESRFLDYWDESSNTEDPRDIRISSERLFNFRCPNCNTVAPGKPHDISRGSICGCTRNKTEKMVLEWIRETYPQYKIEHQMTLPNCPRRLFDITIEDLKVIIEVDGPQHNRQIKGWTPLSLVQKADVYKMICANDEGYSMIRISQEDVWLDRIDWRTILKDLIYRRDSPAVLLVSTKVSDYDNHISLASGLLMTKISIVG